MLLRHKLQLSILVSLLCANVSCTSASNSDLSRYAELCAQATAGNSDIDGIGKLSSSANSYLLDCTLIPLISEVTLSMTSSSSTENIDVKKVELAEFFLSGELDYEYQNDNGSNLLFSVVRSFLPLEWRMNAIAELVTSGINPGARNDFGKTAMEIAKTAEEKELLLGLERK